ncbi:MAG: bifunctional precorrin-2 dehydrogenase/sirohydrochlorin ferrochelatase [Nitrosopumilus sp. B06]|nr:MAG: bifunctional precorrin-2 dehydrogenase/sirohydrochlorin ferrochelatase [Nitrosopumilus sp. B06]
MIIDLKMTGKKVVIVGGGAEAQKRVRSLLGQKCDITVIADSVDPGIKKLASAGKLVLRKKRIQGIGFISELNPDILVAATDDSRLNKKITDAAKRRKILAYRADSPEDSDFANPATIEIGGIVQIAIFTGGRSPAMSKKIRVKSEKALRKVITPEDIVRIKVQDSARRIAKNAIHSQKERKKYLETIMTDARIDQLIKDGQLRKAQRRAAAMLGDRK